MESKRLLLLSLVLLMLTAVSSANLAQAKQEPDAYPSLYLGLAFAAGFDQFDDTSGFSSFDEALGVDVWVGLRANRYFSFEGQFTYLEGFDTEFDNISVEFEVMAFTANVKLYPLEGWIQPYLVAGAGGARLDAEFLGISVDESGVIARLGGGVDVYFSGGFAVVIGGSYLYTGGDIKDTDIVEVKVGIQHKF